jgi:hypothetical protein
VADEKGVSIEAPETPHKQVLLHCILVGLCRCCEQLLVCGLKHIFVVGKFEFDVVFLAGARVGSAFLEARGYTGEDGFGHMDLGCLRVNENSAADLQHMFSESAAVREVVGEVG